MNLRRTRAVAKKEFLHILRDPRSFIMALAIPLLMLLLFGYALTLDVDRIQTLVYDSDRTPQSYELIERFKGSRFFEVIGFSESYGFIEREIDRDRCLLSLVIPRGYGKELVRGGSPKVQVLLDGSDSNTAYIALGYARALLNNFTLEVISGLKNKDVDIHPALPLEVNMRVWYNSELKSKNYIVPGLIAVILMIISALLTSLTIAREWEMGTMEQLLSTPVKSTEIVFGKMLAYFTIGVTDTLIAVLTGVLVFRVPLRGNVFLVFATSCLFLFGSLCTGIMISAAARQQLLAYQMGIISSFLPAFLLSGFIFAIENMPPIVQAITYFIPARYFIKILKGIFLKGVGARVLWVEVFFLFVYASIVFFIATKKIKHTLI